MIINMVKKLFFNGVKYILALIFSVLKRDEHLWLTGKVSSWEYENSPPAFFDNSKYFFLYLVNKTNEKVFWVSSSKREISLLKSLGLPVVKFRSIKGIYLTLRAKYFFHHYGINQIDSILQKNSVQINFWHAMPLKKMRYSVVPKIVGRRYPLLKETIEFGCSSSPYLTDSVLTEMYSLPKKQIIEFGYPRQDILKMNEEENLLFCRRYSKDLLKYIQKAKEFKSIFVYMPTWRDDDPDYFEKIGIDYDLLSSQLKKIDSVLFIKLHPLTRENCFRQYDNIIRISNSVDIYPFLMYVDYLITDYSSICYDFLLLDKEIIFIPYDKEKYLSMRGCYFDYDSVTPGIKFHTFSEFVSNITKLDQLNFKSERKKIKELFFYKYDFNASQRTYEFFINSPHKTL